jgi:hypothetical protein
MAAMVRTRTRAERPDFVSMKARVPRRIQCPDDYTHTISYTISEINNIDFSLDHIKKIIKVIKNNNIIFTLNKKITITDIFNILK